MPDVAVVGSGQSGLIVSRLLGDQSIRVALIERLPALGGQEPERPLTDQLAAEAAASGVVFQQGTVAVRWDGKTLVTLGVEGAACLRCDALVVATGTRPATRGELGIAGDRCAGIVPGSAAVHLTESGVLLGYRPAVVGGGQLAVRCVTLLRRAGAKDVTLIAPNGLNLEPVEATRVLRGWRVVSAHGSSRLSMLIVERDGERDRISADALLLAAERVPMRNIEGAILEAPGVVFCHSRADPKDTDDSMAAAREAAATVAKIVIGSVSEFPGSVIEEEH